MVPPRSIGAALALALVAAAFPPASPGVAVASTAPPRIGAPGMLPPHSGSLLVDYYEAFLKDQNIDAFRRGVAGRYGEGTLIRLLSAGDPRARRASVLALGLFGGFGCNAALARALRDPDPFVRALADNALWAVWFRADTPENNAALERVRDLIRRGRFAEAIEGADRLIARSPAFAEAHNQRAIAHYAQGQLAESVADCRHVLEHNPYHTGALSGMGQCLLRLGRRGEALKAFRRASELQPYHDGLRDQVAELEAADE